MKTKHGIFCKNDVISALYKVDLYIGENDACELYRVLDTKNQLKLLKIIKPDLVSSIDLKKLTIQLDEIAILKHPNIVSHSRLLSFEVKDKKYYYCILDFVSGESLVKLLNRSLSIDIKKSCYIILDVIKAIQFFANLEKPILFKKITPNMVFLNYADSGERVFFSPLEVSDYILDNSKNQLKIDYAYQSNNVLDDNFDNADIVYSLVTLLYKMITGFLPWNYDFDWKATECQFIKNRIKLHREVYPFKKVSQYIDFLPPQLDTIFNKVFNHHSEEKYLTIDSLRLDLKKAVQEEYDCLMPNRLEKINIETHPNTLNNDESILPEIIGMLDLKKLLNQDVIKPIKEIELYKKYGISPLNGILLYGPAGCGKTHIARKLAKELDFYYIEVKPSDLASTYIHGTQEKIAKLFQKAEVNAPTLIFIDEVDAILPKRDLDNLNQHYASEVNEFLVQMTDCISRNIFIVAATNRPEVIEPAILRAGRLDKSIYIGLPDFNTRMEVLKFELKNRPYDGDLDISHLAMITTCYSLSDLKFLINEAAKLALLNHALICLENFKTIINQYPPSISQRQIEEYEKFNNS